MYKYFQNLDLPEFDLDIELNNLIKNNIIRFDSIDDPRAMVRQICLNTIPGKEMDTDFGRGSLVYDWDKSYTKQLEDGSEQLVVPKRDTILNESDFDTICEQFKGTLFEDFYNVLNSKYHLGRVRIMRSDPKSCLSWHHDSSPRIHYPIKTQEGCFMVIEDEVCHMPKNTWWYADTTKKHTAFNSSKEDRIHIVAVILGEK